MDSEHPGPIEWVKSTWRNPAYRFALLFLPYLAVIGYGYPLISKHFLGFVEAFIYATANIEYWLFALFSDQISVHDKNVMFGGFGVLIIDECTGIFEMLIFSSAVFAFPTQWRKKLTGILMGCPLIYLFNILRIAMLIFVGRFFPSIFDFMHLYFWQATLIVMITSVWLLWIIKVVRVNEPVPALPAEYQS